MPMLELVQPNADWYAALEVALTCPPGVRDRRGGEDPWTARPIARPRRVSDDLAWLRQAYDDPVGHGLQPIDDSAAVAAWEADEGASDRLLRLRDRGVLGAGGFLFHETDLAELL